MNFHKPRYRFIYIAALLLSLQYAFTIYINSSFLGQYFDSQTISNLYVAGAIITAFCLIVSGRFLKRFGNWRLVLSGIILEIGTLLTLAFSHNPTIIKIAFLAHQALPPLILFGLDIFLEGILVTVKDTEKTRAYYLTFMNLAFVFAPLTVGFMIEKISFSSVYLVSTLFLGILWLLVFDVFKNVEPVRYRETESFRNVKMFLGRKFLSVIFFLNFLLQCFYVLMVIFMAPYLHNTIGLSWESIGLIYTIMLLPFVLFEAPLGKLFNRFHDEKNIIMAGFLIMSASLLCMAYTQVPSVFLWAALLFLSRIGASFVEVGSEAAFFRRITDKDASFIGLFRLSVPAAYIITPLLGSVIVPALPVTTLFILTSLCLLVGVSATYKARF